MHAVNLRRKGDKPTPTTEAAVAAQEEQAFPEGDGATRGAHVLAPTDGTGSRRAQNDPHGDSGSGHHRTPLMRRASVLWSWCSLLQDRDEQGEREAEAEEPPQP
jgi:hypothetical protein